MAAIEEGEVQHHFLSTRHSVSKSHGTLFPDTRLNTHAWRGLELAPSTSFGDRVSLSLSMTHRADGRLSFDHEKTRPEFFDCACSRAACSSTAFKSTHALRCASRYGMSGADIIERSPPMIVFSGFCVRGCMRVVALVAHTCRAEMLSIVTGVRQSRRANEGPSRATRVGLSIVLSRCFELGLRVL